MEKQKTYCKTRRRRVKGFSNLCAAVASFHRKSVAIFIASLIFPAFFNVCFGSEQENVPELHHIRTETIRTGSGVKSVVMSPNRSRVYSMNLEEMSVYEFDRETRKLMRKLIFIPHTGAGFDYKKNASILSSQEKPVEGHFTHNGRYLWVSLHNGNGVVVWDLKGEEAWGKGVPYKEAWLYERFATEGKNKPAAREGFSKRKVHLLWIKTGRTPKVITSSPDGRYAFVANWHSGTVSVLRIDSDNPKKWHKINDLRTGRVPRGLAVSPDSKYLYVAQMGGNSISIVDLMRLKKVDEIKVGVNPRHIVTDGRFLYVSLNAGSRLAKVDLAMNKVVKYTDTGKYPRTISLSGDGSALFVVCYREDELQAFSTSDLQPLGRWRSALHPVAVDLFEDGQKREAWVGNYTSGTLKVFTFPAVGI